MKEKVFDSLKTAAIVLLFALTLTLSFFYFTKFLGMTAEQGGVAISESLLPSEGGGVGGLIASQLVPEIISAKEAGKGACAITSGEEFMRDIYRTLSPDIAEIFGSSRTCERSETALDSFTDAEEYIYIRFHSYLPSVLLYIHALGADADLSDFDKASIGNVYEIMIVFESGKSGAFVRNSDGETYRLSEKNDGESVMPVKPADLAEYREAAALSYAEFYGGTDGAVLPTTVMISGGLAAPKISVSHGCDDIKSEKELQKGIASLLGINPDKTGNYYDEAAESAVYMPTSGTLTESAEKIVFTSENNQSGGIPFADFSDGKGKEGEYTLPECIAAAERLVRKIKNAYPFLLGGEAEPVITSLSRVGEKIAIEYGIFYGNLAISGEKKVCRIEMTSEKMTYFALYPTSATALASERRRSISSYWRAEMLKSEAEENAIYTLVYKYRQPADDTLMSVEAVPVKIRQVGG